VRFPLFFQYLGGQGWCDRPRKKKRVLEFFSFGFCVFGSLLVFRVYKAPLSSKRTSASLLECFFLTFPLAPPHFFVSLITLLIHKDGTSTTNARVYNETDIVARVLLVERSHFGRRGGITLVVLGAIDRFCRSWRRRRRTRRRRPNASSFFLLVGDRSNERRGKQTIP
jgi:hypothetical protein